MTPHSESLALIKWSKPGIIYVARNRVNGKLYVGQTVQLLERQKAHFRDSSRGSDLVFHRAIRKFGEAVFDWFVVQTCNDRMATDEAEKFWIASLNTITPNGYNMNGGGCGPYKVSPEVCEKIRQSHLGKPLSEEHKKKMSEAIKGRKVSKETRDKISAGHKKISHDHLRGKSHPQYGTHRSEETKRKLSEATKKSMTPERLEELRIFKTGWNPTEETRKKMSETHKAITPRGPDHPWYGKPGARLGKKKSLEEIQKWRETIRENRELRRNQNQLGLDFGNGREL